MHNILIMKKIYIVLFVFLLSNSLFAQTFEEEYIINSGNDTDIQIDEKAEKKINYNFNIGTSFTAWKQGSMFSTYVNPNLNYSLTPRFMVSTGVVISNNTLLSNYYNLGGEDRKSNFVDSYFHVSGIYQVSEKLQVAASVLFRNNHFDTGMNPNAFDNLDYSVSAKYKLTKNIEVGVQVSKRSYNPFMPSYNSPNEITNSGF